MKSILHIPAWYPIETDPIAGLYIKKYIESLALLDVSYRHFVWLFQQNAVQINLNNISEIFKASESKYIGINNTFKNIEYIYSDKIISWSPKVGGNWIRKVSINLVKKLRELSLRPDMIHVHVSYPGLAMAYYVKEIYRCPILLTEHSSRFPDDRFSIYKYNLNQLFSFTNRKVAVSNYLKLKFLSKSVEVIPNFIDIPLVSKRITSSVFTFLVITRIDDDRKRLDLILSALKEVVSEYRAVRLSIIGDGKKKDYYRSLANTLGILNNIDWYGIQMDDDKTSIISKSSCLIVASDIETFSISTIEAHSQGLPVIATKCGGVEELIDSSNGILIEKNSIHALKNAMIWILENYNKFDSNLISQNAFKRFNKNYILTKYLTIYQELTASENL